MSGGTVSLPPPPTVTPLITKHLDIKITNTLTWHDQKLNSLQIHRQNTRINQIGLVRAATFIFTKFHVLLACIARTILTNYAVTRMIGCNCTLTIDFSNASMELRNIILITIAGFTLSYARYGKLRNGYEVMQLHARIWKGLYLAMLCGSS